jgi:hypothetical protein
MKIIVSVNHICTFEWNRGEVEGETDEEGERVGIVPPAKIVCVT